MIHQADNPCHFPTVSGNPCPSKQVAIHSLLLTLPLLQLSFHARNVGIAIINHPFLMVYTIHFMVILGMVYYCFIPALLDIMLLHRALSAMRLLSGLLHVTPTSWSLVMPMQKKIFRGLFAPTKSVPLSS